MQKSSTIRCSGSMSMSLFPPLECLLGGFLNQAATAAGTEGCTESRTRKTHAPPPTEKAATCLSAALLTTYHPSCNLVATPCLMSLLAALLILLQALLISFLGRNSVYSWKGKGWGCFRGKTLRPGSLYCIKVTQNKDLVLRLWRRLR